MMISIVVLRIVKEVEYVESERINPAFPLIISTLFSLKWAESLSFLIIVRSLTRSVTHFVLMLMPPLVILLIPDSLNATRSESLSVRRAVASK